MRNIKSSWGKIGLYLLFLVLFAAPQSAFAGSISVHVTPNNIASSDAFQLTMTSSGMESCTWSRLDNGVDWAWMNQPIPGGPNATVYDSGPLSGWSGPATYRWYFSCADSIGGVYSASALISIAAPAVLPPPPPTVVVNPPSGNVPSAGSWNVDMIPSGSVVACEYFRTSVAYGDFSPVMIPPTPFSTGVQNWAGPGVVTYTFRCVDALGQWSPPASGTVTIGAPVIPPPPPAPTVIVNPPGGNVPHVGSWNVDMIPNGTVTSCEYARNSITYGSFPAVPIPASPFSTGVQNWGGPGMVRYTFRCQDGHGQWSPPASGDVTIGGPALPSGNISGPSSCVVPPSGTSCTVPLSWATNHPAVAMSYLYRDDSTPPVGSGLSGGPSNFVIAYGLGTNVRTFTLIHDGVTLDTKTVTANCSSGESWVSGVCVASALPPNSPIISVSPDPTLEFYGVSLNEHDVQNFTVTNVGPAGSLLTGTALVSGPGFSCFSGCSYYSLPPGTPHVVRVKFAPTGVAGTRIGQTVFSGGGGATRHLNGTALTLTITGALDFDKVMVGKMKPLTLTISNPSSVTDLGSGVFQASAPFSCIHQCAYHLAPNTSHTFTLAFSPTVTGAAATVGTLSTVSGSSFILTGVGISPSVRYSEK